MREPERLDVKFKASMSKSDNCICNACHGAGTVMKLTYPVTKFHDRKKLSTRYYEFWLCDKCREKLSFALNGSHTIDEVQVVRCRDCKNYVIVDEFEDSKRYMCLVNHFSYLDNDGDDHFCSYGERKEGADNDT